MQTFSVFLPSHESKLELCGQMFAPIHYDICIEKTSPAVHKVCSLFGPETDGFNSLKNFQLNER